jgi:hypothetical protein
VEFPESLLQWIKLAVRRETFDGHHLAAVGLHRKHETASDDLAVDQDATSATDTVLASQMRSGKSDFVTQKIREMYARFDLALVELAVDR